MYDFTKLDDTIFSLDQRKDTSALERELLYLIEDLVAVVKGLDRELDRQKRQSTNSADMPYNKKYPRF